MKASDLSSTHPPISERIRILRAMSGASFGDYDQSYRQVHQGGKGIIPVAAVGAAPVEKVIPKDKVEEPD